MSDSAEPEPVGELIVTAGGQAFILRADPQCMAPLKGKYALVTSQANESLALVRRSELDAPWGTDDPVALHGNLEVFDSAAEIISFAASNRSSGDLVFSNEQGWKCLVFAHGEIVGVRSSAIADRLGEVILRSGHLDRHELVANLQVSRQRQSPLGNLLVQEGLLNQAQLLVAVKGQIQQVINSLLFWESGTFILTRRAQSPQTARAHYNAQSLIMEGLRRIDEAKHFVDEFGGLSATVTKCERTDGHTDLGPTAQSILQLLSEPLSIGEVLESVQAPRLETAEALSELNDIGIVAVRERALEANSEASGTDRRLVLLASGFNGIFMRLNELCADRGASERLEGSFDTFLRFYGYAHVLGGSQESEGGKLDVPQMFRNLDRLPNDTRTESLKGALVELLNFQLFAVRGVLSREELKEVHQRSASLNTQLGQLADP